MVMKDIIKVNESKDVMSDEMEEPNEKPTVEFVPQSSSKSGSSDGEESEEDLEEEPDEDPEEQLEEDPGVEPDDDPEEELEEEYVVEYVTPSLSCHKNDETKQLIEDPDEDISEDYDPEEEPKEELSEEPEEESVVEYVTPSMSCHKNDESKPLIEDPDEDISEDYGLKPSSESDTDEADYQSEYGHNYSNEKKRSLDTTAFESAPLQIYQSQKKCKYEETFKPESDVGSAVTVLSKSGDAKAIVNDESVSEQQEHVGSSGKRRRSRWEPKPVQDGETGENDRTSKRRKTRWDSDDTQLKMLGPMQLPDFTIGLIGSELDAETEGLNVRLIEINSKLQSSELHDYRPEEERSPSPEPVYNNLGIRLNTREARLRKKLIQERQQIISKLIKENPTFKTHPDYQPAKFSKKLYVSVKEYPTYNFVGLIIGPRGNTQKRMEKETGAKIRLRGKGAVKTPQKPDPSDNEDMHVLIEADNQKSLDAAVAMVEKLLIPIDDGMNDHKRAQLEELAKLNGTYRDENMCSVCREEGHKHYACPHRQSTFKVNPCDTCGSFCHPTSSCPLTASPQVSNHLWSSTGLGFGSTPNTKSKSNKEISDANLFVGYLPQALDNNLLMVLFSRFGKITEAKVIKDRTTGLSKGYGFVKFDDPIDAAGAVTGMNGFKIGGKMLAVRVAGRPPVVGSSALSHLPMYPGLPAVPRNVPGQTSWPGPPGSMLPEAQVSFPNSDGLGLASSSIYLGHGNHLHKSEVADFPPPYDTACLTDLKTTSSFPSSCESSKQIPFSSPGLAQFPGDPDYIGSFQSYFTTPTLKPSLPFHLNQTPESDLKSISWSSSQLP